MIKATNSPSEAPMSIPGKKRPAGTAMPYSTAQNRNQIRKKTTETQIETAFESVIRLKKNLRASGILLFAVLLCFLQNF